MLGLQLFFSYEVASPHFMKECLTLHSWNVNGIRATIKKGFLDYLDALAPDIVCLQEVKARQEQVEGLPDTYEIYWNPAEKAGYSGVAILTKLPPKRVTRGIGIAKHDTEGRVLTLEFDDWFLVTVYTPNSQNELRRLPYRTTEWDVDFLKYVRGLPKPVIFCGDLNVAHTEIDLARPKPNRRNAGFTDEERASFDNIVSAGYLDSLRVFEPDTPGRYSWWSFRAGARSRNVGWRLDYFLVDKALRRRLQAARIHTEVMGSDHCPVAIDLKLPKKQMRKVRG